MVKDQFIIHRRLTCRKVKAIHTSHLNILIDLTTVAESGLAMTNRGRVVSVGENVEKVNG